MTTTDTTTLTPSVVAENLGYLSDFRRAARRAARCPSRDSVPVVVVEGNAKPREVGSHAYYTTQGGTLIHHPNAYGRKCYDMIRYPSTRHVEVGADWRPVDW
ncbi:MAG TPA: hypothetical protein VI911_07225 [Patescibacteria group bacterium]|nr:hypothetical protein [Patescibacteria group bacterium]